MEVQKMQEEDFDMTQAKPYCFKHNRYFTPHESNSECRSGFLKKDVLAERAAHKKNLDDCKNSYRQMAEMYFADETGKCYHFRVRAEAAEKKVAEYQDWVMKREAEFKVLLETKESINRVQGEDLEKAEGELARIKKDARIILQEIYGEFNGRFGEPNKGNEKIIALMKALAGGEGK